MEDGPLVSVVTPCYNPGAALEDCLDSVAEQGYANVEHIVVDGGSDDGTVERLGARTDVAWISEPDEGQSDALRKGFAQAEGRVLTWLNADDLLAPGSLETTVGALSSRPDVDWVYGHVELSRGTERVILRTPPGVGRRTFWWENRVMQPGTIFSRRAYEAVGGIDVDLHYALDMDLWVRFIHEGFQGLHVDELLAHYPVHEDSKTGSAGVAAFLEEEVRVYLKVGWRRNAAIALGRMAAHRSAATPPYDHDRLAEELREAQAHAAALGFQPDPGLVEGAARAETFRYLSSLGRFDPKPVRDATVWRYQEPRRVAARVLRHRLLGRIRRTPPAHPSVDVIVRGGEAP